MSKLCVPFSTEAFDIHSRKVDDNFEKAGVGPYLDTGGKGTLEYLQYSHCSIVMTLNVDFIRHNNRIWIVKNNNFERHKYYV